MAVALIFGMSATAFAEAGGISPRYAAVNDVRATFTIDSSGQSTSLVTVTPKNSSSIDYISVTASIVRKSTGAAVKTWRNVRVDEPSYIGQFVFAENFQLSSRGTYYLQVTSIKVYKNGSLVETIENMSTVEDAY